MLVILSARFHLRGDSISKPREPRSMVHLGLTCNHGKSPFTTAKHGPLLPILSMEGL